MHQRLYSIFIVSILTLSFFCISCGEETTQEVKDSYRLLRVERQDFTLNREFVVKLESKRNINVRPLVSGRLKKICVQEGAHVKKGQALFVIDQAPYIAAVDAAKAQVATARATLATAQLNLEGKEKLYEQQMIGEFDLHRARYAKEEAYALLETAKAELESARTNLGYTTITSPVDGSIDMMKNRVGDYVSPDGEERFTLLVDNSYFNAYGSISEEMLSGLLHDFKCSSTNELLKKLPPVTFYSNWGYKLPQDGHIDAISGSVDKRVGTVYIRASFTNPTEMLRSGSNGYIMLPYVMHDVIVIPQEAAVDIHDKYLVYKVVDGKAVETEVTIMSYNDGAHFVVTSGLKPGDVIIAEGAGLVKDGIEVTEKKDEKEKEGGNRS
jgi:membrane fusion protein (multidrug efflux system)